MPMDRPPIPEQGDRAAEVAHKVTQKGLDIVLNEIPVLWHAVRRLLDES